MHTVECRSHPLQPSSSQTTLLKETVSESHSQPLTSDNLPLTEDDPYRVEDDDDDLYDPRPEERKISYPPPQKKDFGQDTAVKAAAFAGSEIYVEDMWGELVEAEPGYVPPPRRHGIPRIPEQSIPYIPGQPIPDVELDPLGVGVQVGNYLKGFAKKFFGKVSQHIELQKREPPSHNVGHDAQSDQKFAGTNTRFQHSRK